MDEQNGMIIHCMGIQNKYLKNDMIKIAETQGHQYVYMHVH